MALEERSYEPRTRPQQPTSGPPDDGSSGDLQAEGRQQLNLARDIIDRALSGNSEAFNRSVQQQGGQ